MELEFWVNWAIFAIGMLVIEVLTPGLFYFALIAGAAAIASLLAYLGTNHTLVWVAFFALATLFLLLARPMLMKLLKGEDRPSNIDEIVNQRGVVVSAISPHKPGTVKVKGETWSARSVDAIEANSEVVVEKAEGTFLQVKKV
ncbi:NfeD family protein [bacterium]|nr:NfeD family protein [bacterium]